MVKVYGLAPKAPKFFRKVKTKGKFLVQKVLTSFHVCVREGGWGVVWPARVR